MKGAGLEGKLTAPVECHQESLILRKRGVSNSWLIQEFFKHSTALPLPFISSEPGPLASESV